MASILNVKFLSRQASFEAHQTGITAVDAAIAPSPPLETAAARPAEEGLVLRELRVQPSRCIVVNWSFKARYVA